MGVNVLAAVYGHTSGELLFDPSIPVTDASARINALGLGYFRSLNFFGRTASARIAIPYAWGHIEGNLVGEFREIYRSGFGDTRAQLSVNLYGAPAMRLPEFAKYTAGTNLFASLAVIAPTGQNHSSKAINIGANRWAFKPEIAVAQSFGKWMAELYAGVWFFTNNTSFYPGKSIRKQDPLAAYQAHLIYYFKRNLWAGLDGTYYHGGTSSVDGVDKLDLQGASRFGVTGSMALTPKQSLKLQYARIASIRVGGKFDAVVLTYTYAWFDKK